MLLVSYVSGTLFAVASAFSTTYLMFAALRFSTGFCITGIVIVSAVLSYSAPPPADVTCLPSLRCAQPGGLFASC